MKSVSNDEHIIHCSHFRLSISRKICGRNHLNWVKNASISMNVPRANTSLVSFSFFPWIRFQLMKFLFVGYKRQNDNIDYLVKGINIHDTKIISSGALQQYRPELIINFLQDHMEWENGAKVSFVNNIDKIGRVLPGPKKPKRIICMKSCWIYYSKN